MSESVQFKMQGPVLDKDIPLDIALWALNSFQNIIDKSYLALSGNQRISKKSREEFRITFIEIKKGGSLDANLELIVATAAVAQMTMPFLTSLSAKEIWNLTKDAFNYLKFVLQAASNGKQPTYQQTGDGMLVVNNGDGNITVNQTTYNVGKEAFPDYQELAKLTKSGVDSVAFMKKDEQPEIEVNKSNSAIFFPKAEVLPQNIQLSCEVFDFNKHKKGGKISVLAGQEIPEGEYNFEIVGDQDIVPYIESMLKNQVKVNCLQEMTTDPFGNTKVCKVQIVSVIA
jgi:hypothetical protein